MNIRPMRADDGIPRAVAQVSACLPAVVPARSGPGHGRGNWLGTCDGFLLTGGRPNVHPRNMANRRPRAWRFRPGPRRDHPAAGARLRRAWPAVPGGLPRVPGGERGPGRHASPRDSRPARAGQFTGWPPDGTLEGKVRPAPCRHPGRRRTVPPAVRRRPGADQHAARPGGSRPPAPGS